MEIFTPGKIELRPESVANKLQVTDSLLMQRLLDAAAPALRPKAAFQVSYVEGRENSAVVIGGLRFCSKVLARNLEGIGRVFPYVVTMGAPLDRLVRETRDLLERYLLDEIGNIALMEARSLLQDHLCRKYALEKISFMAPGSLEDWPLQEQTGLFSLLGDVESAIGVSLTDSLIMVPRKSVSGIYFPSEVSFFNCQLCPRERCQGRKARYDIAKAREYGCL
jgi:hypothetical protein